MRLVYSSRLHVCVQGHMTIFGSWIMNLNMKLNLRLLSKFVILPPAAQILLSMTFDCWDTWTFLSCTNSLLSTIQLSGYHTFPKTASSKVWRFGQCNFLIHYHQIIRHEPDTIRSIAHPLLWVWTFTTEDTESRNVNSIVLKAPLWLFQSK